MKKLICILLVFNLVLLIGRSLKDLSAGTGGHGAGVAAIPNGDVNGSGVRDISDAVYLLNWLFSGGPEPVACAGGNSALEDRVAALEAIIYGCFNFIDNNIDSIPDCAQPEVDSDGDGVPRSADCNDGDPTVFPGAQEVCDQRDNDCNGQVDENVNLLTDVNNCGDCGRQCGPGQVCQGGQCVFPGQCPADGMPCDDGDPCTVGDTCVGGQCIGGSPRNCDDGNPCTIDVCGGMGNCSNAFAPNGQTCGMGRVCNNGQCDLLDADQDGFPADMDCDDSNAAINPGRPENCSDMIDNDCDGAIDAADSGC